PEVRIHEAPSSWKSTLSTEVYRSLSRHYGPAEMERQELIYNLSTTEGAFVKAARRVVRVVLLPLRARESRAWLAGLPSEVTRFFDWLEDIVNLHGAIARALSAVAAIWQTGSIVQRVAGTLKGFVPRLEVYMPYLAKYESVRDTMRWHAQQDPGEFGEYLRMKERERAEGEWSLDKLFDEPAARLRGYLETFQVRPS
ncbi:Dbl homology domain-containing protein, partial [Trametes polyzona]